MTTDDFDDTPRCFVCGGPLVFLGTHGTLDHYRCRDCTMQSSRKSPQAREESAGAAPVNVARPLR